MSVLPIAPADKFVVVTPADGTKLVFDGKNFATKGIFVGGAGNLAIKDSVNNSVTFTGVIAGSVLPLETDEVLSTGTTATNIVALF